MMENQISGLKCDTDVFVTFEGDNVVMLQVRLGKCLFLLNSENFKIKCYPEIWSSSYVFIWSLCLIGKCFSIRHLIFAVVEWGKGLINLFPSWFLMLKGIFFGLRKLHLVSVESYIFYLGGYSQRLCKCPEGNHASQVT